MSKDKSRQQKLSFSKEDLNACNKGVLSSSLIKKLRQRFLILLVVGCFLMIFFLGLLSFLLSDKAMIMNQMGENSEITYPVFIGAVLLLNSLFAWIIISNLKKYKGVENESISMIKAELTEIEYYITKNRSLAPYLKVKSFSFGPILPLKNLLEIFNTDSQYLFYYSSKSKTLLAVAEQGKNEQ
jgi:hypothetical protein